MTDSKKSNARAAPGAPLVTRPLAQPAPGRVTRPIETQPVDPFPNRVIR